MARADCVAGCGVRGAARRKRESIEKVWGWVPDAGCQMLGSRGWHSEVLRLWEHWLRSGRAKMWSGRERERTGEDGRAERRGEGQDRRRPLTSMRGSYWPGSWSGG